MADPTNVVNIKPTARKRASKPFEFPKPICEALWHQQRRIYEALAVARLLAEYASSPPHCTLDPDIVENSTAALVRLLEPVKGLTDETYLTQLASAENTPNG